MAHLAYTTMALIGCFTTTYFTVRFGATVIDIIDRTRTGDWTV